ncbi:phenylacetate--CoA ligase family protein [Tautonia plasticadhaerens]|uniref:Phenylacetate-coenzyme A ligase n=1 Tax=Tautonia plasticadhaerens TaxID=2527974 RepID=A0A518H0C5_9BACT|nr:AMP-binding protein [Tautonia plasticadhaerens]QDV34292.1 Phenylacetate-coenzyme A ligase [Tautonia plasticadhaerens]
MGIDPGPGRPTSPTTSIVEPRSAIEGLEWPAVPDPTASRVLALAFQLEHSQWWPPGTLLDHQLRQAGRVVEHARRTSRFYAGRFDGLDLGPGPPSLDQFRSLPTLDRETVQREGPALRSTSRPRSHGEILTMHTSGSTGRPTEVQATGLSCLFLMAHTLRDHLWGRRAFSGSMVLMQSASGRSAEGRFPGWFRGIATGPARVVDVTRPVGELLDLLIEEDPDYLQVHPSTLGALLDRSLRAGVAPGRLKQVKCFGEVLGPTTRERCRVQWGAEVRDCYASEECGPIALQCPESGDLHIQAESTLVEVLDDRGEPCGPGEVGQVHVTPLHNFAMPLIRYGLGDYAEVGAPCPCGRGLPTLRRVVGRVRHLVRLPRGDRIHPEFDEEALRAIADIRQYQLTQVEPERIDVSLVVEGGPLDDDRERLLCDHFDSAFRHRFRYRVRYLDEIPRTPRGKFEVFRCEVDDPRP